MPRPGSDNARKMSDARRKLYFRAIGEWQPNHFLSFFNAESSVGLFAPIMSPMSFYSASGIALYESSVSGSDLRVIGFGVAVTVRVSGSAVRCVTSGGAVRYVTFGSAVRYLTSVSVARVVDFQRRDVNAQLPVALYTTQLPVAM